MLNYVADQVRKGLTYLKQHGATYCHFLLFCLHFVIFRFTESSRPTTAMPDTWPSGWRTRPRSCTSSSPIATSLHSRTRPRTCSPRPFTWPSNIWWSVFRPIWKCRFRLCSTTATTTFTRTIRRQRRLTEFCRFVLLDSELGFYSTFVETFLPFSFLLKLIPCSFLI